MAQSTGPEKAKKSQDIDLPVPLSALRENTAAFYAAGNANLSRGFPGSVESIRHWQFALAMGGTSLTIDIIIYKKYMKENIVIAISKSRVSFSALLSAAFTALLIGLGQALAQDYPSRPVTMVVPFPAGGPTDAVARIVADRMRTSLGQPVVIENVVGGSGSIGVGRVAHATADGYTLSFGTWSTHVVNGAVLALPYDVVGDFEPVSLVSDSPVLIVGKKALPANDLKGLIEWLRANPDKALNGTPGPASAANLAGVLFQNDTGTHFRSVPYRGVGFAMQDLIAGRIDLMFDLVGDAMPQVRAGSIGAYAVLRKSRLAMAPNIPTTDEAGLPGFYVSSWQGIWAPKGTPKSVIGKLNRAVADALGDPGTRQRLVDLAQEIPPLQQLTPEALGALQKAEIEKWWPIIKAAGIKAD